MDIHLEMAPMQGVTDAVFREAFDRFFGGIDETYSPFVLLERGGVRPRDRRELDAGREAGARFTPQIAAGTAAEAGRLRDLLARRGFRRLNLNFGCPFAMLTRKRRGAGALPHPGLVAELLEVLTSGEPPMVVSVKTRLGLLSADELGAVVPILNRYPLEKVILHPRVATQKYGGAPDWRAFGAVAEALDAPVIANGDILTPADARRIVTEHPRVRGLMIGRGLLMDPFLPMRIKGLPLPDRPGAVLEAFHDGVYAALEARLAPPHLLHRMTGFWSYYAESFPRGRKLYKAIRKAKRISVYREVVAGAFQEEP